MPDKDGSPLKNRHDQEYIISILQGELDLATLSVKLQHCG
jgi:hypothetical protein